jgi:hypothetical protein
MLTYEDHRRCKAFWLHQDLVATRVFRLGCSCDTAREVRLAAMAC